MPEKLPAWARRNGIHPKTAYKWYTEGTLPVPAKKIGPKTILIYDDQPETENKEITLYARVSSHDQKQDLENQVQRLTEYALKQGYLIKEIITEIGSGLNENRPQLNKILTNPKTTNILIEHKDRLARHNVNLIISLLKSQGRNLVIMDEKELENDLVSDVLALMTSYAARLHGKRSAENKAKRALQNLQEKE